MKKFDVVILGGGAAGSMCALSAKGKKIAIVDAGSRVAKRNRRRIKVFPGKRKRFKI